MARKGSKILLKYAKTTNASLLISDIVSDCRRARRELNPGQPGVSREVKASPEMTLPVLYLFRTPLRDLAELRARATSDFDLIYIS